MIENLLLKDLLIDTRDGDWGLDTEVDEHEPHYVIRGADFPDARKLVVEGVPLRYLPARTVHRRVLQPDDILLETAGGTRDRPTGRTLLVTEKLLSKFDHPVIGASFTRFLRADPKMVYPRYLFWHLQAMYENGETFEFQVQHTGVARFQYTTFAKTKCIAIPNFGQQRAIADVLGVLDDKIAVNGQLVTAVDEYLSSEFKRLCAGAALGALRDIASVSTAVARPVTNGQLRYLDISTISNGGYDFPAVTDWEKAPGRARRVVRPGDTVWSTVRPNRRSHALIMDDDPLLVGSTGLAVLTPKKGRIACTYESARREEFVQYLEGVAEGSAYPAVRAERFNEAPVPALRDDQWDHFESIALPLRRRSHAATVENRSLTATRDELLPLLMSGKIRAREAEKVAEGVV